MWRHPVQLSQVSPLYLQALLTYEDRWFYYHPGVNPLSLLRAAWQAVEQGRIISGGSTLTMQVARLLAPHPRTLWGKASQIFRALQLEWHYTKAEILTLYLNHAPFGGPLLGIKAASYAYLGRGPDRLSHGEAALLAVLPQAPTRLRPDRNPAGAQKARDKVLDRLQKWGVWSADQVVEAKVERVADHYHPHPFVAPLLARRLKALSKNAHQGTIVSTLDSNLQQSLQGLVETLQGRLPLRSSLAILVMENSPKKVRAYIGSANFWDNTRFGQVDMVQAIRSPGSTLKPFLYGMALEEGLIHSESLLIDAPQSFDGYQPGNFNQGFHGPVSAREALQQSLNVPAVGLLKRLGSHPFVSRLRHGGLKLTIPGEGRPNLAVILGGAGSNLESLVGAYSALAQGGIAGKPRLTQDDPLIEKRLLSPGSAWIIRQLLASANRPDIPTSNLMRGGQRRLAWKTGTSYGFRDAWAVGVTDRYTVGVWVGRPDGTPSPGQFGAQTAAPILFDILNGWPARFWWAQPEPRPHSVQAVEICWPLGTAASRQPADHCHRKRVAWALHETVPPTFLADQPTMGTREPLVHYWINPATGLRVQGACGLANRQPRSRAVWPLPLQPWLSADLLSRSQPPPLDPDCPKEPPPSPTPFALIGLQDGEHLRTPSIDALSPPIKLSRLGGEGPTYWMVDGKMAAKVAAGETFSWPINQPGWHPITAMDENGQFVRIRVHVAKE